jgi:hypothetical protein
VNVLRTTRSQTYPQTPLALADPPDLGRMRTPEGYASPPERSELAVTLETSVGSNMYYEIRKRKTRMRRDRRRRFEPHELPARRAALPRTHRARISLRRR